MFNSIQVNNGLPLITGLRSMMLVKNNCRTLEVAKDRPWPPGTNVQQATYASFVYGELLELVKSQRRVTMPPFGSLILALMDLHGVPSRPRMSNVT